MDGHIRIRSSHRMSRVPVRKSFGECSMPPMKALLQSEKELCTVSAEELKAEKDNFNEVTFLCFADETAVAPKELAAMSVELPDLLKSLHLCTLHENDVIFLKDIHKPLETSVLKQKNYPSRILCVMKLSPSFARHEVDSLFTLLSKYAAGIRCTVEIRSLQKHLSVIPHAEDDDTNQSVSSIEDDFVTALEHLDEDEPTKMINSGQVTPEKLQDAALQTISVQRLESLDPKFHFLHRKPSVKSSTSLVNILELKELSSVRNSVTTSVSDPWLQRSFFRPQNSSDQNVNALCKTLFSSSPAESSESDCSSPSPIIFLDEEGYQRSLKAKLQLPKIPVMKDGIEDSDSEVSEFFDSFDQFDEQEQTLESGCKHARGPVLQHPSHMKMISHKRPRSATAAMNPQRFKVDHPTLPANVRKPTPRKPESPYSNLLDVPDSPRPLKTSGDDSGGLFSPIRSSAFSPLGSCLSTECPCQLGVSRDAINQKHNLVCHPYSDFANNISFEILGSVFNSRSPSSCRCTQEFSNSNRIVSKEETAQSAKTQGETSGKELESRQKSKCKSLKIKDHIQKFASELVEKSFGSAFKDLQKGVSSCTNALCHLAAKLTSSIFQMAFYEIGRQQAFSLKKKAINGLAGFLVSEALTGALKELHSVKQQIFTNTVAKFAANLAEELIFEGIMEVCQFSHPSTPTTFQNWSFHYDDKVIQSYSKDLSESVIQEAFIELSQVEVAFTTQAAISISTDNIKYIGAESSLESTQASNASSEFHDQEPVALNSIQEFREEYTVHKALFCTSGIASSIPVPLAGSILCQNQILFNDIQVRKHSASTGSLKFYKKSAERCCATQKRQDEVTSIRNVYLMTDSSQNSEYNAHIVCTQSDFKQANSPEVSKFSDLTTRMPSVSNFSGTMVDMIVTEAYEAVTSSKTSKNAEQYTEILKLDKTSYLPCIGEDACENMFANYLAKRIVKQSVDETKSACSVTGEKLAYCVGLGTSKKSNRKELHSAIKPSETNKSIPVIVGQQQMPLNSSSRFHVSPVYSNRCLLSGSKDGIQGKKRHVGCRTSTSTSSPCSAVTFVKPAEEFPDAESCSAKSLSSPLGKHNTYKSAGHSALCSTFGPERTFPSINAFTSVATNGEDAFQMEDKLSIRDETPCVLPDTPPPTPLIATQTSSEWNLRKLSKKLKGELAKEFAPATPPSTPYRSETGGVYENERHDLEKEEFMLKLMRSLSEEVESSEDEEHWLVALDERTKASGRTTEYADHLATHIIAVATEMAASHLDYKAVQMENNKCFQISAENKRCGHSGFVNVSEASLHSLLVYAGNMAGKVISEAKKIVESKHCTLLRLKQVNCGADGVRPKINTHKCWSKDMRCPWADQGSQETDSSILSLPQHPETPGLTSKYPSCESVTDEYADHIIRILKREGGHSELIMDQFASRLAYRSIKSGMQEAAGKLRMKYKSKIAPSEGSKVNSKADPGVDGKKQKKGNICHLGQQACGNKCSTHRTECTKLLDFSESLAGSITSDVRRKIMRGACLSKSLTDSCLYKKSKNDQVTDLKATFSKALSPFCCKQKLYHSTGSLNEPTYRNGIIHAIEQYARKVVDDTLEASLESATLQTTENWTNGDRTTYAEKLSPFSATACRYCSMKEHQYSAGSSSLQLTRQELHSQVHQVPRISGICPKSRILHLDIPKIHINMDEKVVFAENVVATVFDKAERQVSHTSLTADSGIGQDGVSFAESLTTEIMTSCMTNISPPANISSVGKEGFNSAESIVSQQMSLSTGDDSTGSWSNLSFEDEQPDENSSFLHLSDSDGTEDKEEELKDTIEGLGNIGKALVIINVDIGPCLVDSQLRMALQWLTASEAEVAELHFHDGVPKEFVLLSKKLQERGWKVGDLFQAVLKYCEVMEKAADGERALGSKTFFGWLQEHV
ncbi:A-kinase anchor protein 11 isoform X2 [Podarcis raffonei]|uniref:A-kinase anchor protein 11 isoform X2 n=1 Tax=Podarcis raffonei TaxID=65483 RepID=UPI0023299E2F|nr:A-kinase anchor protein 11 isoform X2 [Podarcis raffonei]